MSQTLSQVIGQYMRMEQRLTPQLIQSMAILQMPVADLETLIAEELEKNGALEIEEKLESPDRSGEANGRASSAADREEAASFKRLDRLGREYDLDFEDGRSFAARRKPSTVERDGKMEAMANTACRSAGLQEYLTSQWSLLDLPDDIRAAGETIITHIDDDGYLRVPLEQLLEKSKPPTTMETMDWALFEVQNLEPYGVGARDIRECLLLQLDAQPGDNRIERELVEHHLDDIARNRLPAIAKATGYSVGEITEAIKAMRSTLHLHPGLLVVDREVPPIRPDVLVEYAETGGGLTVRLARGNTPHLRISPQYLKMVKDKSNGKDVREFVRKRIDAAGALMDAVGFRRGRLLDVAQAIVDKQREFFESGPEWLKVLRMSDLALELECDPSTISRTVADKYMQTPRGIFPLRSFFTGGLETESGETTSWDSVKARVAEIIRGEDPKSPLNDDRIVDKLKEEGIEISRRTVAKYRQQMSIPPARQRRQF